MNNNKTIVARIYDEDKSYGIYKFWLFGIKHTIYVYAVGIIYKTNENVFETEYHKPKIFKKTWTNNEFFSILFSKQKKFKLYTKHKDATCWVFEEGDDIKIISSKLLYKTTNLAEMFN